jgi:hypothetical protein
MVAFVGSPDFLHFIPGAVPVYKPKKEEEFGESQELKRGI